MWRIAGFIFIIIITTGCSTFIFSFDPNKKYSYAQLEKDFAGIIVPNEFYDRQPKAKEKVPTAESDVKKDDEVEKLFTRSSHHARISMIFTVQNFFRKYIRTIRLN